MTAFQFFVLGLLAALVIKVIVIDARLAAIEKALEKKQDKE